MGVKVAASCLHWTQPSVPRPKRRSFSDGAVLITTTRRSSPIKRTCSATSVSSSSSSFFDEEFTKQLQELAMRFHAPDSITSTEPETCSSSTEHVSGSGKRLFDPLEQPWLLQQHQQLDSIPAGIEWTASSVDLPMSLRMIKRKRQWQESFRESACCSVKKAFSSMVLIMRELQCFSIQTRETIMNQDLNRILSRVQKEMHASFVWLFQHVFSQTPTLMVYVMILLANYSVHSMTAIAVPLPATQTVSIMEYQSYSKFDTSSVRDFSGKTASIDGGGGGGGGDFRPVSSGTDGGGKFRSERTIFPDGVREEESVSVSGQDTTEDEARLWDSIVDKAKEMQSELREEALDDEARQRLVSPVFAEIDTDDYADYFRTELSYQMGLARDPINPLLLANYAQFLYLVAHDYNRAEEYFKRAVKVSPPDAEALNKYATFLWQVKKDTWGAEETYLEAISADPTNSYYAANYAHFLWNTGGEDTCFPIDAPDTSTNTA